VTGMFEIDPRVLLLLLFCSLAWASAEGVVKSLLDLNVNAVGLL
jgi:hypothetical protein